MGGVKSRRTENAMTIPDDWRSLTELAVAIGVPEEDRSKFHRNLQNWQYYRVLPRAFLD